MYEIRIPNLPDDETVTVLLDLLQAHIREAQVYKCGTPLIWGIVPNENEQQ